MSPEIIGLLGIVALLVLMGAGMWIGLCMALVGIVGIAILRGFDQSILISGIMPFEQISFYPLSVLPMFVLMGVIVSECGIGSDLYNTAYKWVGNIRGGLAMATVFACTALGAVTGISSAAIVTMGKAAYPEMKKYQYDEALSTGSIACAGTLDFLIPPSLPFVLYAIFTENSVGKLYMAGILPGLLLAGLFCITIYIITTIRPSAGPPGPKVGFKEKIKSVASSWHIFLLFFLCLGGIYAGIFTPTEAGAIGAAGAIIIALIVRRLTFRILINSFKETALTNRYDFLHHSLSLDVHPFPGREQIAFCDEYVLSAGWMFPLW